MRTTVILKDDLVKKAKKLSGERTLSALLNTCLADWIGLASILLFSSFPFFRLPLTRLGVRLCSGPSLTG